jgi:hypothetical protein
VPIAVEAETVLVTAGLRHQSGNVETVSFHFVNLVIVLHLSGKKDFGVAFQERKHSGTRTPGLRVKMGTLRGIGPNRNFTDKDKTGQPEYKRSKT